MVHSNTDAVLISIHFELLCNIINRTGRKADFGITTLDTRRFATEDNVQQGNEMRRATVHYCTDDAGKGHSEETTAKLRFGRCEIVSSAQMLNTIHSTLTEPYIDENGETRKAVLIGHGIKCDLYQIARELQIITRDDFDIIDLTEACDHFRPADYPCNLSIPLSTILDALKLEYCYLNIAGNNSNFILRATLLAFAQVYATKDTLSSIQGLVNQAIPKSDMTNRHAAIDGPRSNLIYCDKERPGQMPRFGRNRKMTQHKWPKWHSNPDKLRVLCQYFWSN